MARKKGNRRTNGKNKSSSTSRSSSEEPISSSGESTESAESSAESSAKSSAESSAESSVILLESSAEFNFENNLDFRARNLLGKTIKVGANYFDKSYSAMLLSQGKEYEEHIIQRFVSQEDYIKNKVAREFVKNSFTGRRATVVAQDYWFAQESWKERGELVVAFYPFTMTQLKKWNNHVPSISDAKKCIQDLIVKSRMVLKQASTSRDHFLRRLMNECARSKYTPHGSLQTVGPAHFKTADEVGKKTPIKRKSSTQNESPPPSTEATRRAHTIITQKERGHCGHCLNVRKLGTASRLEKNKRAARTTRFCLDCNMFLCMACTKSRRQHRVAYKRRRIK